MRSKNSRKRASGKAASTPEEIQSARWFRAVADYTYDWESWHGVDGKLIWVNPAVERITGFSVAECMAMQDYPMHMVALEDRERVAETLKNALQQTSGENFEFRSTHRSGETRYMSLAWQPMFADADGYLGVRTSVRDVTERQRLRVQLRLHADHLEQLVQERSARLQQLEQRHRKMEKLAALGQLAAGVAHEINNPLAGIRNGFELIKSDLGPEHSHYELFTLIDAEIERISGIVHQMYQLYRRSPQTATEIQLGRIAREVVLMLDHIARKHDVKLRCLPAENLLTAILPEGEVKQILYNLIRNAIQASPAGAEVTVTTAEGPQEVFIYVQDLGAGIPDDVLPRIFDPFFSTKPAGDSQGMGLGLSVSRSLIEAMGGRVEVVNSSSRGTLFCAAFPCRPEPPQETWNG